MYSSPPRSALWLVQTSLETSLKWGSYLIQAYLCLLSHYCARMLRRWRLKAKGAMTAYCHSTSESTGTFSPTWCNCTYFYRKGRLAMVTSCVLFFLGGRVGGECRWFVKLVVSVWLLKKVVYMTAGWWSLCSQDCSCLCGQVAWHQCRVGRGERICGGS